jgi:hypothetical protein
VRPSLICSSSNFGSGGEHAEEVPELLGENVNVDKDVSQAAIDVIQAQLKMNSEFASGSKIKDTPL